MSSTKFESQDSLDGLFELLVAGGYFRARIQGLSDFDKIAGGLAWGILSSREAIDVEFVEGAQIGQKVPIAENIIAALKMMRCPHPLAEHQVTQLDDIKALYPVFQWLLKQVISAREANAAAMRAHADLTFSRSVAAVPAISHSSLSRLTPPLVRSPHVRQAPQRAYKRATPATAASSDPTERASHFLSVLLEYGEAASVGGMAGGGGDKADAEVDRVVSAADEDALREQLAALAIRNRVSASALREVVGGGGTAAAAAALATRLDGVRAELAAEEEQRNIVGTLQKNLAAAKERVGAATAAAEEAASAAAAAAADVEAADAAVAKKTSSCERMRSEIERETAEAAADERLRESLRVYRARKAAAAAADDAVVQFEREVAMKVKEWKSKQEDLLAQLPDESGSSEELRELEERRAEAEARVEREARRYSKKAALVQALQMELCEIPNRLELQTYQERFRILHLQMGFRFEETKQHFARYNSLSERERFVRNEVELLDNILESSAAQLRTKDKKGRERYATTIAEKLAAVKQMCEKFRARVEAAESSTAAVVATHAALQKQLREHLQQVKALDSAMKKNQTLSEQIESLRAAA